MITVKAFDKGLICKGFKYEVGKTYTIPTEKVKMCVFGFHASANCDISETLNYYPDVERNEYALVDINVVDEKYDKVVGGKIKIIKRLDTLDELTKYDATGEWCYTFAKYIKGADIKKLQDAVIQKDKTGKWCCSFAEDIPNADIQKLENAVIEKDKDKDGKWIYWFVKNVQNADIQKLENVVIEKDKTGEWWHLFCRKH